MKIFYLFISFSISFYLLKIFKKKFRIKKQFDIYFASLKNLKVISNKPDETKKILDEISLSGIKLISYGSVLVLPYIFCFLTSYALIKNYPLSIVFSGLPYFSFFYFDR